MKQSKIRRSWVTVLAFASAGLLAAGCAANEGAGDKKPESGSSTTEDSGETEQKLSGTYAGAGASSQEAAQAAWIAEFQTANPDVTINYNPVGSGGGRKQFLEGAVVYAGSDSYLSDEEIAGGTPGGCAADTGALNLPVYISPIAVVFNLDGVDRLDLDAETIAKIFKGEILTWDDPAIAASNPDATLPATAITVVYRSDDSGTTKNFADYLHANVPDIWTEKASDKFPFSFDGAEGTQGSSGVVDTVKGGTGTIGYVDASKAKGMSSVALKVGDEYVPHSPEGAAALIDASPRPEGRADGDLAVDIDRTTTAKGAYPLVLVSYLIVCQQYEDAKNAEFVKAYVGYAASEDGQKAAEAGAGSAPVSAALRDEIQAAVDSIK